MTDTCSGLHPQPTRTTQSNVPRNRSEAINRAFVQALQMRQIYFLCQIANDIFYIVPCCFNIRDITKSGHILSHIFIVSIILLFLLEEQQCTCILIEVWNYLHVVYNSTIQCFSIRIRFIMHAVHVLTRQFCYKKNVLNLHNYQFPIKICYIMYRRIIFTSTLPFSSQCNYFR